MKLYRAVKAFYRAWQGSSYSRFLPYKLPEPTVKCLACEWQGVGVQTKIGRTYASRGTCPQCGGKKLDWGKYTKSVKRDETLSGQRQEREVLLP